MSISGGLEAKCKVCGCVFNWSMGNFPFIDAEIVGTCDDCFNKKNHDIFHENIVNENDCPEVVGRIMFDKGTHHFEDTDGKFLKKAAIARLMYWGKKPYVKVKKRLLEAKKK